MSLGRLWGEGEACIRSSLSVWGVAVAVVVAVAIYTRTPPGFWKRGSEQGWKGSQYGISKAFREQWRGSTKRGIGIPLEQHQVRRNQNRNNTHNQANGLTIYT